MSAPRKRAKTLGVGRTIRLRAYDIFRQHMGLTTRAMFRAAAAEHDLDPRGVLTEAQWSLACDVLIRDACEVLDFNDRGSDA